MPVTSAEVVLSVDPLTARAYRDASDEEKAQARSAFERSLAERREQAHREAGQELLDVMDEMAREAEAHGLTPEILAQILDEDRLGADLA